MQPLTLQQAKELRKNSILRSLVQNNSDGTPQRFKILSIKKWKRQPNRILISCKRGLYEFIKIDETQIHFYT